MEMKRGDIPLMLFCGIMFCFAACGGQSETASGGGMEQVIDERLQPAYALVADKYDFSGVDLIMGDIPGFYGLYENGVITVSQHINSVYTTKQTACLLVHELEHHRGGDQVAAVAAESDCLMNVLRNHV